MLCFPQLVTGAASQFPTSRRARKRTISNTQDDGRMWKVADPSWSLIEWELELKGLTYAEWNSIETLFHAVEGRLGSFLFLDPTDNLLSQSEDLSAAAWTKDPFLQLTTGISDPLGTTRATRLANSAGVGQRLEQTLEIPGWFQYCLSLYARSSSTGTLMLVARTGTSAGTKELPIGPTWRRLEYSVKLSNADELIHLGVDVPPGGSVDVFGLQAEPQIGASKYKKTLIQSGVYPEAWFLDDELAVKAEGPDQYSCVVRIGARG